MVSEPANKAVILTDCISYQQYVMLKFTTGTPSAQCLIQTVVTVFYGLKFLEYSPFYEEFNDKIGQMISAGVTENLNNKRRFEKKADDIGPQVLTMEHLEVAFIACMIPFIVCIIVFVVEISIFQIKNCVEKLIAAYIVKAYIGK